MEKRFVAFIALSALILIGWTILARRFFPAPPAPVAAPVELSASPSPAASPLPQAPAPAPPAAGTPAVTAEKDEEIRVETDHAEIVLTNSGGRVRSWRLKKYETAGRSVDLVSRVASRIDVLPLSLVFDDKSVLPEANKALYRVTREPVDGGERVTFRWADGAGSSVEKSLVLRAGTPLVALEVQAVDRGRPVVPA